MKSHDTLIQLLLDLEEEMRNRYNAHVEIEYFNESDIYLRVYFAPAGFGFNYRIDTTFIEKEHKYLNVKDLADHISEQIDRKIVEHFKYGHIGFNNLEYDCYMLWAASMGQGNQELYDLSQNIIFAKKSAP